MTSMATWPTPPACYSSSRNWLNLLKKYVVIPNSGHMLHLQMRQLAFQHEVTGFFNAPWSGRHFGVWCRCAALQLIWAFQNPHPMLAYRECHCATRSIASQKRPAKSQQCLERIGIVAAVFQIQQSAWKHFLTWQTGILNPSDLCLRVSQVAKVGESVSSWRSTPLTKFGWTQHLHDRPTAPGLGAGADVRNLKACAQPCPNSADAHHIRERLKVDSHIRQQFQLDSRVAKGNVSIDRADATKLIGMIIVPFPVYERILSWVWASNLISYWEFINDQISQGVQESFDQALPRKVFATFKVV
jgi:hypothetical protein